MYPATQDLSHGSGRKGGGGESGQTGPHSGLPDQTGESTGECPPHWLQKGKGGLGEDLPRHCLMFYPIVYSFA